MYKKRSDTQRIHVLLFKDCGYWIAQCLEYDIAVQSDTIENLKKEFVLTIKAYIDIAIENNQQPFVDIPQTPQEFWEMYKKGNEFKEILRISYHPTFNNIEDTPQSEYIPYEASLAVSDCPV